MNTVFFAANFVPVSRNPVEPLPVNQESTVQSSGSLGNKQELVW